MNEKSENENGNIFDTFEETYITKKSDNVKSFEHLHEYTKKEKDENDDPIKNFQKLKKEVELIEQDLNYYQNNKSNYKSIASLEDTLEELKNIKSIIDSINKSKSYNTINLITEIKSKNGFKVEEDDYSILNKKLYKKLDDKLTENLCKIKKLKNKNPLNNKNIEYELFLVRNFQFIEQLKKLDDMKNKIKLIEEKIGNMNNNNKKNNISQIIDILKNKIMMISSQDQEDLDSIISNAEEKIGDIKNNKLNMEEIKNLNNINVKNVEKIIVNSIYTMDIQKNNLEQSAYLNHRLKDLISKNEKMKEQISSKIAILDKLQDSVIENINSLTKNIAFIKNKYKI